MPMAPTTCCSVHTCLPPNLQAGTESEFPLSLSYAHPRTWHGGDAQRRPLTGIIIGLGLEGSVLRRPLVQNQKVDICD